MEYKSFPAFTKQIDERTVSGFAAVFGNVDHQNDRLWKGAFRKTLQENGHRVRHLWQHDWSQPPVATILELREVGRRELPPELREEFPDATGGLLVTRRYFDTPRANEILAAITADPPAVTEMSFGFDPVKFDFEEHKELGLIRNLREVRLWDTSDVNWGANPATLAAKVAIPFRDTGKAPEGEAWRRPTLSDFTDQSFEDLSEAERRRIAQHFAWSANMPPETFGDLKLPHHRPSRSGVGPAVWAGVRAAMAALLGARGGVDIPEGDRRAVYNHLRRHYEQFDKEPPDFHLIELAHAVRAAREGALSGAVEPALDWKRLAELLGELEELLRAEPPVKALTPQAVLTRLRIAERELALLTEVSNGER